MYRRIARALLMTGLLAGGGLAAGALPPASAACTAPAPNQSPFGSRELSVRVCERQHAAAERHEQRQQAARVNTNTRAASVK